MRDALRLIAEAEAAHMLRGAGMSGGAQRPWRFAGFERDAGSGRATLAGKGACLSASSQKEAA